MTVLMAFYFQKAALVHTRYLVVANQHSVDRFTADIATMMSRFVALLEQAVADPDR